MEKKDVVLLFDGIGEIIDESILEKDPEISKMYIEKYQEYQSYVEKEIDKYCPGKGQEDGVIWDWVKKYIYDYCMFQKWKSYMNVNCILPYSMGLITAITCFDGISFESGLKIIIASYYYSNCRKQEMLMLMVVGFDKQELHNLIQEKCKENTIFEAADIGHNYTLLSGEKKSVDCLVPLLIEGGAIRVNTIETPEAYHTKFAKEYIEVFEKVVDSVEVKDISTPICSMYSNQYISKADELKRELVINLYSRMHVISCIKRVKSDGKTTFFEIGATKSLYKIYRKIDEKITIIKHLN